MARPLRIFFYIFIYLSPKIVEKFFFCQNPFPAILRRKKILMATKPRGGGLKALVAGPLIKELFYAASLTNVNDLCFRIDKVHMTGDAGSRDNVGTPQYSQRTPHIPLKNRLRPSLKNSVRVANYLK